MCVCVCVCVCVCDGGVRTEQAKLLYEVFAQISHTDVVVSCFKSHVFNFFRTCGRTKYFYEIFAQVCSLLNHVQLLD